MSYKDSRAGLLNTERRIFRGVGPFDIPEILPIEADVTGLEAVGFNYALTETHPENKVLHFFLDDYQFRRVWDNPDKYLDLLRSFKYVVAPDFSLYTDHPLAVQIFNHYRKHWLARYWQENGVNVIPCICWSDGRSFDWCFDGEPYNSTICVSTIGGFGNHNCNTKGWLDGYAEMHRQLKPSRVIIFGKEYNDIPKSGPTYILRNEQLYRKSTLSAKPVSENDKQIAIVEYEEIEDVAN